MIEYIPQALSSLGAATNIISNLLSLRDFSKHASQLTELQRHIIQANSMIISEQQNYSLLTAKIQELEKETMRLKDWSAEKQNYTRKQITKGVFAYVENNFVGNFEEAHKLCCNCFEKTIKSTLQQDSTPRTMWKLHLVCPNGCPPLVFEQPLFDEPRR